MSNYRPMEGHDVSQIEAFLNIYNYDANYRPNERLEGN